MLGTPRWAFDWLILLVVATLLVGLGYRVWRDRPARDVNRWFAFQALVLSAWVTGVAGSHSGVMLTFWGPWTFASAALLPLAFLGLTGVFPERTAQVHRWLWVTIGTASIVFGVVCLTTPWVVHSFVPTSQGIRRLPGPLYPVYAIFLPLSTATLFAIQIARWRRARGRARLQLQYHNVGVLILALGGFTANLVIPTFTGRSTYSVFGPYFALAYLALVAHAIIRHRLLDLRIVVDRSLTFGAAVLVSLLPAGVVLAFFWPQLVGRLARDEVIVGVVAVLGVALLTPPLRDIAGNLLDRYVYRHRSNVRRVLREASSALSQVLELERVTAIITTAVTDVIRPEGVALYLPTNQELCLASSTTARPTITFSAPNEIPPSVLRATTAVPNALLVADDVERLAGQDTADLERVFRDYEWALIVPLSSHGTLVGILVIGRKLSGDPFSSEDLDAISTLANHAGSAVRNAHLYAESALAKDYIANIVTTIPSGVIAVSMEGHIVLFNRAAEQLSGIADSEAGASIETLPSQLSDALRTALVSSERRTYPQISVSFSDPGRLAICTTAPLHDHAGQPAGAVAVFSDLTPVRELERERSRAERLAGFQLLTQALAHEIANPISPIKTMTRLLEQRGDDRVFIQEFQRIVTRELNRVERLIARLRTVGRPQRPITTRVDLRKAVLAAVEILVATGEERGISLTYNLTDGDVVVIGDLAEFEEMFLNLIKNAIEAIPEGDTGDKTVHANVAIMEGDAVVEIVDSGSGFPAELIDQIFVPFVSTKPRGSGLGLAICASVVQRAGGRIEVANRPHGGGIVNVRLPLAGSGPRS